MVVKLLKDRQKRKKENLETSRDMTPHIQGVLSNSICSKTQNRLKLKARRQKLSANSSQKRAKY